MISFMDFRSAPSSPSDAQAERLRRFGITQSVDIHCHCLPGVDDGPATLADSLDLCRALVRDGITNVIATPHQLGRYEGQNAPAQVRAAVSQLQASLSESNIPLSIAPGGDVRVDHRLTSMLNDDEICTLADTARYLLLELPHETYIELRNLVSAFRENGRTIIVSHPERHMVLSRKPDAILPWLENGAVLQVTAGSLLGHFGATAESVAWKWLEQGQVQLVATDAHNISSRPPTLTLAINRIAQRLGESVAKCVCVENPRRVLHGEILLPCERRSAKK